MPKRIQRKRTKGWKMPSKTIYVGRGSQWGNKYKIGKDGNREKCIDRFYNDCMYFATHDYAGFIKWLLPLKSRDIACWCKEEDVCHGDVLLRLVRMHL